MEQHGARLLWAGWAIQNLDAPPPRSPLSDQCKLRSTRLSCRTIKLSGRWEMALGCSGCLVADTDALAARLPHQGSLSLQQLPPASPASDHQHIALGCSCCLAKTSINRQPKYPTSQCALPGGPVCSCQKGKDAPSCGRKGSSWLGPLPASPADWLWSHHAPLPEFPIKERASSGWRLLRPASGVRGP